MRFSSSWNAGQSSTSETKAAATRIMPRAIIAGVTWQALDYADGLVRVGVQSATARPETAALIRKMMTERGMPVPPENRTIQSICVTDICQGLP